ncbi:MAG: DUF4831 family protein [Bacteroidia bacterium]|nr:DUF4831 family protein [Bacteroidales bacterium]NCD41543.1 DUF4831 family protein [Bacteroidia bacterium]MDD2323646.1 DUF4831 family protein [Bacteroidales bacterium]MDD3011044.1 DUF4831 family protein [Bacteroidales bacterium]MDD3961834.1 DUF4831 family protein [Bacteroidales bacterium]
MKKFFLFFLLLLGVAPLVGAQSRQVVTQNDNGIACTLPATALIIEVTVERMDSYPGPLADYAGPLLGIQHPLRQRQTSYRITGVALRDYVISDLATFSRLHYSGEKSKEEQRSMVSLHTNGTLAGINMPGLSPSASPSFSYSLPEWSMKAPDYDLYLSCPSQVTVTDTLVQLVTLDGTTVRDVSYSQRVIAYQEADKANDFVDKIERIRSERMNLLSGYQEVAYPEGTLRYMDGEFQRMEEAYLSLFRGVQTREEKVFTFFVIPEKQHLKKPLFVCGFSESDGVSYSGRTAGKGIELHFHADNIPEVSSPEVKGLTYRLPVAGSVVVHYVHEILGGGVFLFPQFGPVITVPASTHPSAMIDPKTGAATSISMD